MFQVTGVAMAGRAKARADSQDLSIVSDTESGTQSDGAPTTASSEGTCVAAWMCS